MTQLGEIGEFGLIQLLAQGERLDKNVIMGIGDDTAVMDNGVDALLYTTDMLVEEIHFRLQTTSAYELGQKALAVNMSDVAAMGGTPTFALVSLGLPQYISVEFVQELYQGIHHMAKMGDVQIVGGDTVHNPGGLVINVALLGKAAQEKVVLRSGAQLGDVICVTNTLGDSAAGLALLASGKQIPPELTNVVQKHLIPQPRIFEGQKLAGIATSMLDVSDGLAGDLGHICTSSKVRAQICLEKLPISEGVVQAAKFLGKDPLDWVLFGGEDFELLFTIPAQSHIPINAAIIGQIISGPPEVELIHKHGSKVLGLGAYNHFA